jgi:DNA-binding MarR family transcriptional regulator
LPDVENIGTLTHRQNGRRNGGGRTRRGEAQVPSRQPVTIPRRDRAVRASTVSPQPAFELALSRNSDLIQCLLFVLEFSDTSAKDWQKHKKSLALFFSRGGGLHLLLMLLNAHYNKPATGRRPGWVFSVLQDRIRVSERALRMLLADAVAEGLIVQIPGVRDRRTRTYCLTPPVIAAWEELSAKLGGALPQILATFAPGFLANVDYRVWDPQQPPEAQVPRRPPSETLHKK